MECRAHPARFPPAATFPPLLLQLDDALQSHRPRAACADRQCYFQAQAEQIDELQKTVKAQAELLAARN